MKVYEKVKSKSTTGKPRNGKTLKENLEKQYTYGVAVNSATVLVHF